MQLMISRAASALHAEKCLGMKLNIVNGYMGANQAPQILTSANSWGIHLYFYIRKKEQSRGRLEDYDFFKNTHIWSPSD